MYTYVGLEGGVSLLAHQIMEATTMSHLYCLRDPVLWDTSVFIFW